jgi:hypothetical protein
MAAEGLKMQGKDHLLQDFTETKKRWKAEEDLESWNEREVGEKRGKRTGRWSFNDVC